jgi:hypothetical protein
MRFLLATALFIVSISLLLVGLAQRTIWAPPATFTVSLKGEVIQPYLVIPPEALALMPGDASISASGEGTVFIGVGAESDVTSWVGSSNQAIAEINDEGDSLAVSEKLGTGKLANPAGSDLWQSETVAEGFSTLTVPSGDDLAVLVASDGTALAPENIVITWPIEPPTLTSNIFLGSGLVLLVIAILFNLFAVRKMIKNRGPRRRVPKAPQGPRYRPKKTNYDLPKRGRRSAARKIAVVPLSIALVFSLSGCQIASVPTPTPSASESAPTSIVDKIKPAVTISQASKILGHIQEVVAQADESGDVELLKTRVAGPSLSLRQTNYVLRSKSADVPLLAPISSSMVSLKIISKTNLWPRSFMLVTGGSDELPQALVIQQLSPREPYKLTYDISLLPGVEFPRLSSPEEGSIPLEPGSLLLKVKPLELATSYGDVIDKGAQSEFYNLFDVLGDQFYEEISAIQKAQPEKLADATTTFSHALGNENIISLATSDSGAVVALMMTDTWKIRPKSSGSVVAVSGKERLLLGSEISTQGVSTQYGNMLLFYVPISDSTQKIKLLGATQALLSIRSL